MFDFPDTPVVGDIVTGPNSDLVWDGVKWAAAPATTPVGDYVLKAGDTMTGGLIIEGSNLTIPGDGFGVILGGGGQLYKKAGAGIVLRESSGGQQPQIENYDGSGGRDILTGGQAGLGSGTGRQRLFTWSGMIWVKGMVMKQFSNGTYMLSFEFYARNSNVGDGANSSGWTLKLDTKGHAGSGGSPLAGISVHAPNSVAIQSDTTSTTMTLYYQMLVGAFASTGGGAETGVERGYVTTPFTAVYGG